jgi:cholesterol oxidase
MNPTVTSGKTLPSILPESVKLIKEYSKAVNGVSNVLAIETIAGIPLNSHISGGGHGCDFK